MRHRAEIDEAHFRLTRRMENGSYKTVFYDAQKNPLWEVVSQGQLKETTHLEIQPPAQEGGAGETEEAQGTSANVTKTGGARRSSKEDESDEEEDDDDSAGDSAEEDEETADKHKKPSKVKPRKALKLEEAMKREKVKKGDFLKKRREEEDKMERQEQEDKKKKSDGESELDFTSDEEFDGPGDDNLTTVDEIINAYNGAEKNFT
ncbi:nucleolin-like [Paramacrobiotus metropolitanus]|uniref:nucleolin-like n=1 Tax=Paramacrobiotus metropolitanus TaxID=2943436 RepID=UPI002445F8E9|nr:nucleolin-like [Paramacrobiotus metropolitanus]